MFSSFTIIGERDQFRWGGGGGWSLLPEYFLQRLPENQVFLPENCHFKNSGGGGGGGGRQLPSPLPASYAYVYYKEPKVKSLSLSLLRSLVVY